MEPSIGQTSAAASVVDGSSPLGSGDSGVPASSSSRTPKMVRFSDSPHTPVSEKEYLREQRRRPSVDATPPASKGAEAGSSESTSNGERNRSKAGSGSSNAGRSKASGGKEPEDLEVAQGVVVSGRGVKGLEAMWQRVVPKLPFYSDIGSSDWKEACHLQLCVIAAPTGEVNFRSAYA